MSTISGVQPTFLKPSLIERDGCSRRLLPIYELTRDSEERVQLVNQFVAAKLVHLGSDKTVKNTLYLDDIHNELKQGLLALDGAKTSNLLSFSISFDCLVTNVDGEQKRDYVNFPLKIPKIHLSNQVILNYDTVLPLYDGTKNTLYRRLEKLYDLGKSIVNKDDSKHGHCPGYLSNNSSQDQYIRHTEQMLVAYLVTEHASRMLKNYLVAELRGKHSLMKSVKVYNMGLHMHSTKTCCAPCEYVLTGFMNDRTEKGFLYQFPIICKENITPCQDKRSVVRFRFPKNTQFQVLVTVSASQLDADHKKKIEYEETDFDWYSIKKKKKKSYKRIYTAYFDEHYDRRRIPSADISMLSLRTISLSGSSATRYSPETVEKISKKKNEENKVALVPRNLFPDNE
ncbi:MAG: hypothetical protein KDK63_03385 [Chlamydiia bacterium]|nr:hypothetical protein [Chlamydiia bacterium]